MEQDGFLDELEELEYGGVEEVVAVVVGHQGVHHRDKQVTLHTQTNTMTTTEQTYDERLIF